MSVNIKENDALNGIAKLIPASNITLSSLPDTNITLPQAEQSLGYDEASGRWINYNVRISVYYSDDFRGLNISCTKGQTTITKTAPIDGNAVVFYVNEKGTWTVSAEIGATSYTDTVVVTSFGVTYPAQLVTSSSETPEGATVEPTDDIQIWLACANLDKPYTTLEAVLADRETFETLIADSNACDYMARSTTWAYKGLVPKMTSNTAPEGECFASSVHTDATLGSQAWNAFDGNFDKAWHANTQQAFPQSVGYKFVNATEVKVAKVRPLIYQGNSRLKQYKFQASNDNSTWVDLTETLTADNQTTGTKMTQTDCYAGSWVEAKFTQNIGSYLYYRLVDNSSWDSNKACIVEVQFYSDVDITTDKDAMALIGKYDYCSNALLGNATWLQAIANSDYFEEVLNVKVPVMTSDTTPSGQVYAPNAHSNYQGWKAFDGNTSTRYSPTTSNIIPDYITYDFGKPVSIYLFKGVNAQANVGSATAWATKNFTIRSSDDNSTFAENGSGQMPQSGDVVSVVLNSATKRYWQFYCTSSWLTGTNQLMSVSELQFYGRASKEVLVPLVPTMTSNTTPSGECISSSNQSDTDAYMAFDQNDSTLWASNTLGSSWLGYTFTSKQNVSRFRLKYYADRVVPSVTVQGSDDGTTWNDIETITTSASADAEYSFDNNTSYYEYRLVFNMSSGVRATIYRVQFYSKTVQTNIVHSCANDTIYYMEDGSPVIVATTNSDGDGVLDFSSLEDKVYTFYSSVAKNPNDLTLDFCKRIRVTNSEYGGTTEMYLNPDATSMLYWYGYKGENLEDCTSANGWSGNYTYVAPTHNVNSVTLATSSNQLSGIGTKNTISASKINTIALSNGSGGNNSYIIANTTKSTASYTNLQQLSTTESLITETNAITNEYASIRSAVGNTTYVKAFWYDRVTQHIPTFISASNDMLYIMNGATKVYIANTNGEGKSYEPLLEAGTYTIYSSVAKDPNNLSNPYSKTVTIDESTQTITIMPSNALYWYGYKSDNLEECTTTNGWSVQTYSMVSPTYNATNMTLLAGSSQLAGVGTKSKVNLSTVKAIATGVTAVSSIYGVEAIATAKNISSLTKYVYLSTNTMSLVTFDADTSGEYNITFYSTAGRNNTLHALWYE